MKVDGKELLEVLTRMEGIKQEIWQISESYTKITNGKMCYDLTEKEKSIVLFFI